MALKLVLFDLDGTLLDTLDDLADASNWALREAGLPERTREQVRSFVGNGVRTQCERLAGPGADEAVIARVMELFKARYGEHMTDKTAPYPGVEALLAELGELGLKRAVVSNKYAAAAEKVCEKCLSGLYDAVIGEGEGVRKKPAPDGANKAMATFGVAAEDAVYVGDSDVDVATARNANLRVIGVTWGFRARETLAAAGADYIVDTADELMATLAAL